MIRALRRPPAAPRRRQEGFIIINPYAYASSGGSGLVDAADFDGVNDHLEVATLTGQVDSKSGIFSVWVKFDAPASQPYIFTAEVGGGNACAFQVGDPSGGGNVLGCSLSSGVAASDALYLWSTTLLNTTSWFHALMAWDLAAGVKQIYINDANAIDTVNSTHSNVAVDWGGATAWKVGRLGGGIRIDGGLAELYFAPGQYLDISVEANRRKFRSLAGKPVDLGATGSAPTGTAPLCFLHLADGESAANFATNRGTGGNFTTVGALTTYASSPSD